MAIIEIGSGVSYSITEKMNSDDYTGTGGYTINKDTGAHFVAARKSGSETESAVLKVKTSGEARKNYPFNLGHANDCAYYNGYYYVAQGGGAEAELSTVVKRFNNNLELDTEHEYTYQADPNITNGEALTDISCIAYIKNGFFLVGEGRHYSVCKIDHEENVLAEVSRITLSKTELENYIDREGYDRVGQGIYVDVADKRLYKVYSHKNLGEENSDDKGKVNQNDIAWFDLQGPTPSYTGVAPLHISFQCDRENMHKFELEAIASTDGDTYYIATNEAIKESEDDEVIHCDSIYQISFTY